MLSGCFKDILLNLFHKPLAVTREKFYHFFIGFVCPKQAKFFIIAGAVDGGIEYFIQTKHFRSPCFFQNALGAGCSMNVTAKDMICIVENGTWIVGKNYFAVSTCFPDQLFIVFHIVYTGKTMFFISEQFTIFILRQYIRIRIDPGFFYIVQGNQMVTDFISRIGEHQNNFLCPFGNSAQANSKPVTAEDWEDHANSISTEFSPDIFCNIIYRGIVTLCPGNYRFRHCDNISVSDGKTPLLIFRGSQNRFCDQLCNVISLTDNRCPNPAGNSSNQTAHSISPLFMELNQELDYYTTNCFFCKYFFRNATFLSYRYDTKTIQKRSGILVQLNKTFTLYGRFIKQHIRDQSIFIKVIEYFKAF